MGVQSFERGDSYAHHRPLEVHLQVASGCNLDCYMCHEHLRPADARHGKGIEFVSPELFAKLEREVLPYSSRLYFGVGGEPMLSPHFLDQIERAHGASQQVHLMTNATRIATDEVAERLARCVSSIEISADGATRQTYERIRGGASFNRLVANVERLNRFRFERPADERPRLTLCYVLMQSNIDELPLYVELAARLRADAVAAWHVIPVTREGREDSLAGTNGRADEALGRARERAVELGIELDLPGRGENTVNGEARGGGDRGRAVEHMRGLDARTETGAGAEQRVHCHMPSLALYVFYDGRVYPCGHPHAHEGTPLGNLHEQSFGEIWNGRAFRNLRAGLASGDAPALCLSCPIIHGWPLDEAPDWEANGDLVSHFGARDLGREQEPASAGGAPPPASGMIGTLEQERERIGALEHERDALARHARTVELERDALARTRETLESERSGLAAHAGHLESERAGMAAHIANLEDERERRRVRDARSILERLRDRLLDR